MATNANALLVNGFTKGEDGKLRVGGKMVSAAVAKAAEEGQIIAGFDIAEFKKQKARTAASGEVSLVDALEKISPNIALLKVGMTAKIKMPTDKVIRKGKGGVEKELDPKRSFVMSVVTKLNHITAKGREWEGRVFDTISDPEGENLYVARLPDTDEPHVRKIGGGGKKKTDSASNLEKALAASKAHLGGDPEKKVEGEDQITNNESKEIEQQAEEVLKGGEVSTEGGITEQATVVKH